VKRNVDRFLANDPAAYAETCRMLGACNLESALSGMKVPAAIVVGDEDYATPVAMAETLCRGIKGSTLTILKGRAPPHPARGAGRHRGRAAAPDPARASPMNISGEITVRRRARRCSTSSRMHPSSPPASRA